MRFTKIGVLLFGLLVLQTISAAVPAYAAETKNAFNLTTSPTSLNLSGEPGTTITSEIRIKNNSTSSERLKVTLMKFTADGEEGKPSLQERGKDDDYFDWFTMTPSAFDAEPNEWKTVKITIALPKTAAFGYYYAPVFSREGNPEPTAKANSLLGSVAVLALVEARVPNAKRVATIASLTSLKKTYEFLPATFAVKVRNTGNVHLVPGGDLIIKRGKKEVARLPVNKVRGNILPNSNRIFTMSWDDGYPAYAEKTKNGVVVRGKDNEPVKTLSWNTDKISHLRIGKYTAHVLMVYDDGTRDVPLEATVSFWVMPWRLLGVILFVLIVPAGCVYFIMRWRIKRIRKVTKRV